MPFVIILICLFSTNVFAQKKQAAGNSVKVKISWSYKDFKQKIDLYEPVSTYRGKFVSETRIVSRLSEAPIGKKIEGDLTAKILGGTSAVLVVENNSPEEIYFFAVPHTLNPHHASAGHYFECLCIQQVYKVPPGKIWYRIVRVNLNESFEKISSFEINHQIIGLTKEKALRDYKDQIYGSSK